MNIAEIKKHFIENKPNYKINLLLNSCIKLIESFGHYDLELCDQEDIDNIIYAKKIIKLFQNN